MQIPRARLQVLRTVLQIGVNSVDGVGEVWVCEGRGFGVGVGVGVGGQVVVLKLSARAGVLSIHNARCIRGQSRLSRLL
jgi:hypothetical protein